MSIERTYPSSARRRRRNLIGEVYRRFEQVGLKLIAAA